MISILPLFNSKRGIRTSATDPSISISRKGVFSISASALKLIGAQVGQSVNFAFDAESNTFYLTANMIAMHDGYTLRQSKSTKATQFYCKELAEKILRGYGLYGLEDNTFKRTIQTEPIDGIFYPIHKPGDR